MREKIGRIRQLYDYGFNIPRMLYVPYNSVSQMRGEIVDFLKCSDGTANIRTYRPGREGFNNPHIVDISVDEVMDVLSELNKIYVCMIDLEHPSHGLYAGNIQIFDDGTFILEFCHEPDGGAVVRNANKSVDGTYNKRTRNITVLVGDELSKELEHVVRKAFDFDLFSSVILEWSYQRLPCGVRMVNDIWWEYRDASQ